MTLEGSQTGAAAGAPVREGDVLVGRYRLESIVGEGGMGVVWAARQLPTERPCAVKIIKDVDADNLARFLREARVSASLVHRHIVQVFDFGEIADRNIAFMVMELLSGETLASKLRSEGKLSADRMRELMLPVLRAVRAAHDAGVVHRDLKPENVFIAREYDGLTSIKVLDFGLAKATALATEATSITRTGAVMGTPFYMAPEQIYGEKHLDARVDVWAAGVMIYECLTGLRPFTGENIGQVFRQISSGKYQPMSELASSVPTELEALVARMLVHDRDRRIASLSEVMEKLGEPEPPPPPITAPLPTEPANAPTAERTPSGLTRDMTVGAMTPNPPAQVSARSLPPPPARSTVMAFVSGAFVVALVLGVAIGMKVQASRHPAPTLGIVLSGTSPPVSADPLPSPAPLQTIASAPTSAPSSAVSSTPAVTPAVPKKPPARPGKPTAAASASDPLSGPRF